MKKTALLTLTLLFSLSVLSQTPYSQRMVESHGLGDFKCNTSYKADLATAGWDYVSGLVANSVLKAWEMYPAKTEYYNAVKAFADKCVSADGSKILSLSGNDALGPSNIDDLAAGKIFFRLYTEETKKGNFKDADKYKKAATLIRNKLKFNHSRIAKGLPGEGGFYHKASYPSQMWLDGLYMGPAVYAQWQNMFGITDSVKTNESSWSDIANQFKTIHQKTYDAEKQLNYHAWAAIPTDANAFWSNKTDPYKGCSKEFWGRGMGWYFAALVDVLELMPKTHPDYNNLLVIYNQVAAGLKRWQDKDSGVWYQLLQYDASKKADGKGDYIGSTAYNVGSKPNYLESSCSSMFTYAFYKGLRLGLLEKTLYQPVAEKAYEGLVKTFIVENGSKIDIIKSCASAGLGPSKDLSRTGTANYYLVGKDVSITQNEGKAIGTFIMASIEKEMQDSLATKILCSKTTTENYCLFEAPKDGIYLFKYFDGTASVSHKQSCKAGTNAVSMYATNNQNMSIYSENGMLVGTIRLED